MHPQTPTRPHRTAPANRLLLGLGLLAAVQAGAQVALPEWRRAPAYGDEYPNHVEIGAGAVDVDGDAGAFEANTGIYDGWTGGVRELHYYKEIGEDFDELTIDLRALGGAAEVELDASYEKFDEWFFAIGARQYREFYDASGGFDPVTGAWFAPDEESRELDWGRVWVEFGTLSTERPQIHVRFSHHYRDGEKDSTSWGIGAPASGFNIGPSLLEIDETRDVLELSVNHDTGERRWGAQARYEHADLDNALVADSAFDTILQVPLSREQASEVETDSFSGSTYLSQKVNEAMTVSVGASALTLDANIGGSGGFSTANSFTSLRGDSDLTRYEFNANVQYRWTKHLESVLALGAVRESLEGDTVADYVSAGARESEVDREETSFDLALETRYTGFKNTVLYVLAEAGMGDEDNEQRGYLASAASDIDLDSDGDPRTLKLSAGARWQATRQLSFGAEYFHRRHRERWDHTRLDGQPFGTAYPGFLDELDYTTDDVNLRATWRPSGALTLVSRIDYRVSEIDSRSAGSGGAGAVAASGQEADLENLGLSQSVSWMVRPGLFLQGSAHYVVNTQDNPANDLGGALSGFVLESENDYWNANLGAFAILDEKTDLQVDYDYYRADNYTDGATATLPLNAGDEQHRVNLVLSRQLSERVRGVLRYGFYKGDDEASGGNNDYEAHLIYASLRYRF